MISWEYSLLALKKWQRFFCFATRPTVEFSDVNTGCVELWRNFVVEDFFFIKKFRCGNTNLHNCHNFQLSVSYDEHQFENTFHNWITILSSTLVNFSSPVFGCMRMALVCWILSGSPSFKGSLANIHLYVCISLNVFIPLLSKCEVNPHLIYMRS